MNFTLDRKTTFGFLFTLLILMAIAISSYQSSLAVSAATEARSDAAKTLSLIDAVLSVAKDAETGQRGYLLTGNDNYLKPYSEAISLAGSSLLNLGQSIGSDHEQRERLNSLESLIHDKFSELGETVRLRKSGDANAALALVKTNRGKEMMDRIRELTTKMKEFANSQLSSRIRIADQAYLRNLWLSVCGSSLAFLLIVLAIWLVNRDMLKRRKAERDVADLNAELELRIRVRTSELETKTRLLSTVLEQMPAAVIVAEAPSGKLILSNSQFQTVWRQTMIPSENVEGYGEWIGFHPNGSRYAGSDWPLARALQKEEIIKGEETEVQLGDGTRGVLSLSAAPIRDSDGKMVGAIVICEDVTDRKRAEEERIKARSAETAAHASTRLKSEFLANMSHEIRTPLNGILGMTDLLLDTPLNELQKKYARILHDSGNGLLTLVNDILDFSKVEAGKMELEVVDFNLVILIEGQADLLSVKAREKNLSLMTYVDPRIPLSLRGDPGRLSQVLLNLVGNAIKFTEKGSVVTRVLLKEKSESRAVLTFRVEDTGIGLSSEAKAKLFQPFTQADGSTARKYGGTGLGLSISKRIVGLMDGEIEIESVEGQGSTFKFTCPFDYVDGPFQTPSLPPEKLVELKILVVEDDPPAGEIVSHYLQKWEMRSTLVNGGEQAFQILLQSAVAGEEFDLALIDNQMPGMDGISLAEKIRRTPELSNLKLVMITAFDRQSLSSTAFKAGFLAYLTKPLKQSELYNSILKAVSRAPIEMPEHTIKSKEILGASTRADGRPWRILVAEDNQINQILALALLKFLGYSSHSVANGIEAIAAFQQGLFDLILMDCQMPEMDGYEATAAIRKLEGASNAARIPIIALTANAMKEDEMRCLNAGMDGHLAKPVNKERLAAVLREKLWEPIRLS